MNEPKRWMQEGPPEAVARLLAAATAEQPSEASLSRSLSGLGIGIGAVTAAGTAGAAVGTAGAAAGTAGAVAGGAASTAGGAATASAAAGAAAAAVTGTAVKSAALGGAVLKWTFVALAVGGGGVMAERAIRQNPPAVPVATVTAQPTPSAPASATVSRPSETSSPAPLTSVPPPRSAPPSERIRERTVAVPETPIDAEHLAEEVRAVDRSRQLLSSGRPSETLASLDEYERAFAVRRFAPEAMYLRMEALIELGQTAAASEVAARLVKRYPNSPQAPRARQVLERTNP